MIVNDIATYMEDLTATHPICSAMGGTFANGVNLFVAYEPKKDVDTLTIIPYSGARPNRDKQRQTAAIQLRLKTHSRYKALNVQQACIDNLDSNYLNGNGFMRANESAPLIIGSIDNDRWTISVSNYTVKYLK